MNAHHSRQNSDPGGQSRRLARNEDGDALVVYDMQQVMRYMYDDLSFDEASVVNPDVAHEHMAHFLVRRASTGKFHSKVRFVNDKRVGLIEETLAWPIPTEQKISHLGHLGVQPLAQAA